ncbi:3-hydroxyacyl-ACP dehydratase FabZ family protein [Salinispora sp. H7-4]|uniref:3-hydroxyacyl-ACP dehydratase FabZ family protein n=1 Tax=Salinispora sp. H7-4 TaxID=2748321 RepID=UPI0015D2FF61|nr:hypothetical protein [Salinispora sp. H7-4]NYT96271.1 hypothetical protein [Salinispora sp. H7-4]
MSTASPLGTALEPLRRDADGAVAAFTVDPADSVLLGHYPGFPVLPGVYLIEAADRTVKHWSEGGPAVRLTTVTRCQFLHPVYPSDRVVTEVTVTGADGDELVCQAQVRTGRGKVADVRLRYARETR